MSLKLDMNVAQNIRLRAASKRHQQNKLNNRYVVLLSTSGDSIVSLQQIFIQLAFLGDYFCFVFTPIKFRLDFYLLKCRWNFIWLAIEL